MKKSTYKTPNNKLSWILSELSMVICFVLFFLICNLDLIAQCRIDYSNYHIVFEDDFNYSSVSDPGFIANWKTYDTYSGPNFGYGTELYKPSQITFPSPGIMRLTAKEIPPISVPCPGCPGPNPRPDVNFLSGMISSTADYNLGIFEARMKLPKWPLWPAFWLQARNGCNDEIDIEESTGQYISSTIHDYTPSGDVACGFSIRDIEEFTNDFHIFTCVWTNEQVTFFIDGRETRTVSTSQENVYDHCGGTLGDQLLIDLATYSYSNPGYLDVDYVRVYAPNKSGKTAYKSDKESINHDIFTNDAVTNVPIPSGSEVSTDHSSITFDPTHADAVFYKGTDNTLYLCEKISGLWSVSNILPSPLTADSKIMGDILYDHNSGKLIYKGMDSRLQYFIYDNWGSGWGWQHGYIDNNWSSSANLVSSTQGAMALDVDGSVFYIGQDNTIRHWQSGTPDIYSLMPYSYCDPGLGYPCADEAAGDILVGDNHQIYYKGLDRRLQSFYLDGSGNYVHEWLDINWGTSAYSVNSKPGSMVVGSGQEIFYIGIDDKLHRYYNDFVTGWIPDDMTYSYGNPSLVYPNADYALNGITYDNVTRKVEYFGYDGRLQYFGWDAGTASWFHDWIDNYWNTYQFGTFNSSSSTSYHPSVIFHPLGPTFYMGDCAYLDYNLDPVDEHQHLRYFNYEPCQVTIPCGTFRNLDREGYIGNNTVTNLVSNEVEVYPNPSNNGIFTISAGLKNGIFQINDVSGRKIIEKSFTDLNEKIDLSHEANGIYFLIIKAENGTSSKKLIMNK